MIKEQEVGLPTSELCRKHGLDLPPKIRAIQKESLFS